MNRCQFVADHQRRYGVKRLCQILGIARSSFYHWVKTAPARAARDAADARLAAEIRVIHKDSSGTYGAPRGTAEPNEAGQHVNRKKVARVMRKFGIAGLRLRRRHKTTIADQSAAKAPDLLGRPTLLVNVRYEGPPAHSRNSPRSVMNSARSRAWEGSGASSAAISRAPISHTAV